MSFTPGNSQLLFGVTENGGVHSFNPLVNVEGPTLLPAQFGLNFPYQRVIPTTFYGTVDVDPAHAAETGATFPNFTGMSFAPGQIQDQAYQDVIIAVTSDGWLYAFSVEGNSIVPENVFYNGRAAIPLVSSTTGATVGTNAVGIAFSTAQASPWHQTTDRRDNAGHGIATNQPTDQSRIRFQNAATSL